MREILEEVEAWRSEGLPVAVATVVETWGSAPRRAGAKMALTDDGRIAGSVSGGCVEGAVVEAGRETLANGRPQLRQFGVADETAWDVGLACGGQIRIFVEPLNEEIHTAVADLFQADGTGALVTVIDGPEDVLGRKRLLKGETAVLGDLGPTLNEAADNLAGQALDAARPQTAVVAVGAESVELLAEVILPAPSLVMVGGVHIAVALATLARTLGYRTVVVDPRRAFGSPERFAHADQLIQAWPAEAFRQVAIGPTTAVVMLTHDPKIDDPALTIALESRSFYVGALGSRRTHRQRRARLLAAGLSQAQLDRVHAPIGLDIGAQTPEEIALAIMAEVVATRHGA